jgi:hypothetical protein
VDLEVLDLLARRILATVDARDRVGATTAAALAAGVADRNVATLTPRAEEAAAAADAAGTFRRSPWWREGSAPRWLDETLS